jgi:glycine oxidase
MIAAAAELGETQTPEHALASHARQLWPDFAREIEAASGIDIGYRENGSLLIATTPEQFADYETRAKADPDLQALSAAEAFAMERMLTREITGALWAPKEAQVDNRMLGQALGHAFVRAGGKLIVNETVVHFETHAGRAVAVRSSAAFYEADIFILAAGAWSGLIGGLPENAIPPVKPMKGEMLSLIPPRGVAVPSRVVWGHDVYLVPRAGKLLVGATLEDVGFDTSVTDAAEDWLSSRAVSVLPGLRQWKIDEHWAGLRPGSPDGLPLLGETAVTGLFVASGQYRNGILFAPAVAEILAGLVLERPTDAFAFDPRRFAGSPAPSSDIR